MMSEPEDTAQAGDTAAPLYADVALPLPQNELYTYFIPEKLANSIKIGARVLVPFVKSTKTGVVVSLSNITSLKKVRSIIDLADTDPPVPTYLLDLCRWIAGYYCCSLGEALQAAHPAGILTESKRMVRLKADTGDELLQHQGYAGKIAEIIEQLQGGNPVRLTTLRRRLNHPGLMSELTALERRGIVSIYHDFSGRSFKPLFEILLSLNRELSDDYLDTWLNNNERRKPKQTLIVRYLRGSPPVLRKSLMVDTNVSSSVVKQLVTDGIVVEKRREVIRDSAWYLPEDEDFTHTAEQLKAIKAVKEALESGEFSPFLLHGVTGSGKTEVYLEVISHCLKLGRSAIVLVPEIALTPQIASRFRRRFGGQVALMHSRISAGERYDSWRRLGQGKARVVIGARSALFAPMKDLGLIIVDEEHENTYKQEEIRPYYQGRDCAVALAKMLKIPVALGSATPSIETYENARRGKYRLLELPYRVAGGRFSQLRMVDLTQENILISDTSISTELMTAIEDRLSHGDKIIILQNRRGFATFIKCLHCAQVETCLNCSVTLTYHITNRRLRCHLCGFQKRLSIVCSSCGGSELLQCGAGTQRVEEDLMRLFPDARIGRMDLDTTVSADSHFRILKNFQEGKFDILLGTQMVAKGLDFPDVTLVGVISADTELLRPDFRSEERTFRLLVQAAGRSGRHRPGEVVVQTYNPEHKVFDFVKSNEYLGFFSKTIRDRRSLNYPPFGRLIALRISGLDEAKVAQAAARLAQEIPRGDFHILGPSQALLYKVKRRYRYNLLVKMKLLPVEKLAEIKTVILKARDNMMKRFRGDNISCEIDVDPVSLF